MVPSTIFEVFTRDLIRGLSALGIISEIQCIIVLQTCVLLYYIIVKPRFYDRDQTRFQLSDFQMPGNLIKKTRFNRGLDEEVDRIHSHLYFKMGLDTNSGIFWYVQCVAEKWL